MHEPFGINFPLLVKIVLRFLKIGTAFGIYKLSIKIYHESLNHDIMKTFTNKLIVVLAVTVGTIIGIVKGEEARQKWVFKIRNKYDSRRLMAERKSIARNGGVLLDDIEMASFHNN